MISTYFRENTDPQTLALLQEELLRVVCRGGHYGTFSLPDGTPVEGATETDVIKHLTSRHDFVNGRKARFPGIGSGWYFPEAVEASGFKLIKARNHRGQPCTIVTVA